MNLVSIALVVARLLGLTRRLIALGKGAGILVATGYLTVW